jgi:tricorn protease
MRRRCLLLLSAVILTVMSITPSAELCAADAEAKNHRPHAGMLLYPDVSATHIVFLYANDLWLVPREGGLARPLAGPRGREGFPRFSPDGQSVAFMGNYDGDMDLYTVPVSGGVATRVTHHPATEILCDWTADGKLLFYSNGLADMQRKSNIFTVAPGGGLPRKLPVPYGTVAAISPDGQWLAYTPNTRDNRTWKRYRGGMATDIWLFHLKKHTWKAITDWEGTDTQPMWHGQTVYYLSDNGKEFRLNIWAYDTKTGKRRQVTTFNDYDVKWPAIGPGPDGKGEIVFQNGSRLYLLDLGTEKSKTVDVVIPGDRRTIRPRSVDANKFVQSIGISSTGKRLVVEGRGDVWTVAAKNGPPRNLTRTSGVFERDPSWSPDGRWIAYFSDKTGEYELTITQSDGQGKTRQLTKGGKTFRTRPNWSPDSKHILFSDKTGAMYVTNVKTGKTKHVDTDTYSRPLRGSWSHDSTWVAYAKSGKMQGSSSVWLFELATGKKHHVTSGMFTDSWPTFDRKGDYLFLASNRRFTSPQYDDLGTSFIYANTDILLAVPLRKDMKLPWAPKIDDETFTRKRTKPVKKPVAAKRPGKNPLGALLGLLGVKSKSLKIDLDGFERRAVILRAPAGSYSRLAVGADGKLFYVRGGGRGSSTPPGIYAFDMAKRSESPVVSGASRYSMSADGKKLLVRRGTSNYIVAAAPSQKLTSAVSLSDMTATVDPRAEWKQILTDVWRVQRDFFYDPHMHGVNWPAMLKQYQAMLDDCATREDVSYVIGEMISELNVGHAYVRGGGDTESGPSVNVGLLGCDFELHNGAFRIAKIHEGAAWDADARGPLSQPGVNVKAGDYLLAVNGTPLDTSKDPWAAFVGLAGKVTSITVSSKPKKDDSARELVVRPMLSEANLRYRAWVEKNRAYVAKKTGGRVGYIHVPDTGFNGQNELVRQFFGQRQKGALIIDERWNGGGQIPTRFIELLNRPVTNYWATRNGRDWTWPPDAHQGPKCMLINGMAGSGGDAFPAYFRQAGLGKLVGRRTWGGLVGISGNPTLIDGGRISAPTFAYYETDGTWGIEGHGVDPDIDVIDDPSKMVRGGDPQLDAGIAQMLKELKTRPYRKPNRPRYPVRTGIGIRPEDK